MSKKWKKMTAFLCAVMLVITMLPLPAGAVSKPAFTKSITSLYENTSVKGVYTYTLKNVSKGQTVKWSVSGTGKSYVKLQKTSTKVTKTTVSNKLTVRSKGKSAAKNKTVQITAKVYAKSGKLLYTIRSKTAKLKARPTGISIVSGLADDEELLIGKKYQFRYKITPANSTSSNSWTAMDEEGDLVSDMTKTGAFTPKTEGNYTIIVQAKIGSKVIQSATKIVTVGRTMKSVKQIAANRIEAVFSSSARGAVKKENFKVSTSAGVPVAVKEISFSEDGTKVYLTTESNLKDGVGYSVSDGKMSWDFTAHVGKPVSIKILTTEVTVGKETPVEYALYDKNGIDVQAAYPGTVKYETKLTNGVITKDNKLYMTEVGGKGTVSIIYTCSEDPSLVFQYTGTVICVAEVLSTDTNFTLTASEQKPDYDRTSYQDCRKVAAGENYYIHFRALDKNKGEIAYDSITCESSDPDVLLINNKGGGTVKATAIKPGTVKIVVTAAYGAQEYTYSYEVTVENPPYLKSIVLDENSITMSNRGGYGYKGYIEVEGRDQYGKEIALTNETAQITGGTSKNMAVYDGAKNRIVIDAAYCSTGTYSFALSLTANGRTAKADFKVIVVAPQENGTVSYKLEMDQPVLDLTLDASSKAAELEEEKTVTVRLAELRGGIFYQYAYIQEIRIEKDGLYYSTDLTKAGTAGEQVNGPAQMFTLSAVKVTGSTCAKAAAGLYSVEVKFYPQGTGSAQLASARGYLELTDSQETASVSVVRTTADTSCKNALALARNCLAVTGGQGEIVGCSVTGSTKTGSEYTLEAGESVNIKTVTVQRTMTLADGKVLVSNIVVSLGKTLKNK